MEGSVMTLVKRANGNYSSFPSLIDSLFSRDWMDWSTSNFSGTNTTLPAVNIRETDNDYEVEVAAPGMKKDDFKVNIDKNQLTISSERSEEKNDQKEDYYSRKEFSYQSFQRSFTLPDNLVDDEKISAKYSDGILYVRLPKREEVKPKPARIIRIG
jgi:HSP20 family protein